MSFYFCKGNEGIQDNICKNVNQKYENQKMFFGIFQKVEKHGFRCCREYCREGEGFYQFPIQGYVVVYNFIHNKNTIPKFLKSDHIFFDCFVVQNRVILFIFPRFQIFSYRVCASEAGDFVNC